MTSMKRHKEADVGITEYVSCDVPGFTGLFKELGEDFHVHEVDLHGEIMHLTELIEPAEQESRGEGEPRNANRELQNATKEDQPTPTPANETDELDLLTLAKLGPGYELEPAVLEDLNANLGATATAAIVRFMQQERPPANCNVTAWREAGAEPFIDLPWEDLGDGSGSREARTLAHKALCQNLAGVLKGETLVEARKVRIWMEDAEIHMKRQLGIPQRRQNSRFRQPSRASGRVWRSFWPKDRPAYLHFRLYKENCNTEEAMQLIARYVCRGPKRFYWAGRKDRWAVTVQQVCVDHLDAECLRHVARQSYWDKRLRISNLEYRDDRLFLGKLYGNHFRIVLRKVPRDDVESGTVDRAFARVAEQGFLNYFGMQRFGTSHLIGAALYKRDWNEAVRLILSKAEEATQAAEGESPAESKDPLKIYLRMMEATRKEQHTEQKLLDLLARGVSPEESLRVLKMRSFYLHAAASVVWNFVLSRRVREFGFTARAGDLVFEDGAEEAWLEVKNGGYNKTSPLPGVRELSEEEVESVGLEDVLLPLPGESVTYPKYLLPFYEEAVQELFGLSRQDIEHSDLLTLNGCYRRMLIKPKDLEWRTQEAVKTKILQSDLDMLLAQDGRTAEVLREVQGVTEDDRCVVFNCTLPAGSYLTMMLRELTKEGASEWRFGE